LIFLSIYATIKPMSSLSLGIVGLPNVGKSTLFNALSKSAAAQASNYPFTTIDPNVGTVAVPDIRLGALADIVQPQKVLPAVVEFWDIAGIIRGASQGEGLGNQFLSHIRQTAATLLVVRCFTHPDVIHVNGSIDPRSDLETVQLELMLADLGTVERSLDRYRKAARGGDAQAVECAAYAEKLFATLETAKPARLVPATTPAEQIVARELQLLSAKPSLVIANVNEEEMISNSSELAKKYNLTDLLPPGTEIIPICAQVEAELASLDSVEQIEFLQSYGLKESGLDRLIQSAYRLLNLQTFFTAGPQEVRAWTVPIGATAPEAAGVIHTDFIKGFIRAETIAYADYTKFNGETGAKEAGRLRLEGKEYIVQDGDVFHFRINN
jgi:GTP-binding protein YchF